MQASAIGYASDECRCEQHLLLLKLVQLRNDIEQRCVRNM